MHPPFRGLEGSLWYNAAVLHPGIRVTLVLTAVGTLSAAALWGAKQWVERRYRGSIVSPSQAPQAPIAIVFGAGLRWNGTPTPVLHDRVATAVELYSLGKVAGLLMSGSRFSEGYDEPRAMKELAISLGVPGPAIQTDTGGTRTLTTCRRAQTEFGIDRALLVSQSYHLPRALATCEGLGMSAVGVSADRREYHPRALRYWETREIPATLFALLETRLVGKN